MAQVRNVVQDMAAGPPEDVAPRTTFAGWLIAGAFTAVLTTTMVWAIMDLASLASLAQTQPGAFVLMAFGFLWLGVFLQIPLAPVSGSSSDAAA